MSLYQYVKQSVKFRTQKVVHMFVAPPNMRQSKNQQAQQQRVLRKKWEQTSSSSSPTPTAVVRVVSYDVFYHRS